MPDIQRLEQRYERIRSQLAELTAKTRDRTARMATVAALLHNKMPHFFWTGFYRLIENELVVGPYQGSLACLVLPHEVGVCWAAVKARQTVVVPDVHEFPGHVACDNRSRSEIVVPLLDASGKAWAVMDVDSVRVGAFGEADRAGLERIATLI